MFCPKTDLLDHLRRCHLSAFSRLGTSHLVSLALKQGTLDIGAPIDSLVLARLSVRLLNRLARDLKHRSFYFSERNLLFFGLRLPSEDAV
jgi:hypothetical protein